MNKQKQYKKVSGKGTTNKFRILRKIEKFIDENAAFIMIVNWILLFIIEMLAILLGLLGILTEHEYKIMSLMAALPMFLTLLFDVILMIFFR